MKIMKLSGFAGCEFEKAWIGKCDKDIKGAGDYCDQHKNTKCAVCGKQATQECPDSIMSLVCGAPLCNDDYCRIIHTYAGHPNSLSYIDLMEQHHKLEKAPLIFSRMNDTIPLFDGRYRLGIMYYNKITELFHISTVESAPTADKIERLLGIYKKLEMLGDRPIYRYNGKLGRTIDSNKRDDLIKLFKKVDIDDIIVPED